MRITLDELFLTHLFLTAFSTVSNDTCGWMDRQMDGVGNGQMGRWVNEWKGTSIFSDIVFP